MALTWLRGSVNEMQILPSDYPVLIFNHSIPSGATLERTIGSWMIRTQGSPSGLATLIFAGFAIGLYWQFPGDTNLYDPWNTPEAGDTLLQEQFTWRGSQTITPWRAPYDGIGRFDSKSRRFNSSAADARVAFHIGQSTGDPMQDFTFITMQMFCLYSTPD